MLRYNFVVVRIIYLTIIAFFYFIFSVVSVLVFFFQVWITSVGGGGGGACSHIMAASDPHLRCPGCRDCFLPGNPCSVCESLSAEQVALAIQARSLRLRRQARRAGSADSSSQCGPLEDKTGPPGSTPGLPVSKQGEGLTSPHCLIQGPVHLSFGRVECKCGRVYPSNNWLWTGKTRPT